MRKKLTDMDNGVVIARMPGEGWRWGKVEEGTRGISGGGWRLNPG